MKSASQAYFDRLESALASVRAIELAMLELDDEHRPCADMLNWGHVGDIAHVDELLARVVSDMGIKQNS